MRFESVIGQQEISLKLIQMVQQNRLSHALLLLGKEGSGALAVARAFAQYLVCEKIADIHSKKKKITSLFNEITEECYPSVQTTLTDSCGECNACRKATDLVHPDIHFSYPVIPRKPNDKPKSTDFIKEWRVFVKQQPYGNVYDWLQFIGAENKQGNITSNECEDILRKLSLKSFEAEYKILIMWIPELLGKEGNKLLKLIEEPPVNTLFMLVAENETLVLPTIISRTQLIKIPRLTAEDVESALILRENISSEKARQVASISSGNYHEALQLLQHADNDWEVLLRNWLNCILRTGPAEQVKWIDEISKIGREKQKQFFKYFTHLLHHSIRVRAMGFDIAGIKESQSTNDFANRLNKLCSIAQQEAIVKELDNATYYIERNANAKILFHALTIKLYYIISNKSLILMN
ncbi:MAG: hypothetical protein ABIP80_05775 [Ferruginibacter sp.]